MVVYEAGTVWRQRRALHHANWKGEETHLGSGSMTDGDWKSDMR